MHSCCDLKNVKEKQMNNTINTPNENGSDDEVSMNVEIKRSYDNEQRLLYMYYCCFLFRILASFVWLFLSLEKKCLILFLGSNSIVRNVSICVYIQFNV